MQNIIYSLVAALCAFATLSAQTLGREVVVLETPYGIMKIRLFDETPRHKANFLKLVKSGYYDSLLFHRVINQFMIQGGDPLSKRAKPGDSLGHGDLGYMVPAEFNRRIIHRKGRLCAARESDDINPDMASSACQFYIVMGKTRNAEDLVKYEARINKNRFANCRRNYFKSERGKQLNGIRDRCQVSGKTDSAGLVSAKIEGEIKDLFNREPEYRFDSCQVETYTSLGGTPHLDGSYTVFGEVTDGLEVIDKIAAAQTDKRDRPITDIRMRMYIEKKKAKKSKIIGRC